MWTDREFYAAQKLEQSSSWLKANRLADRPAHSIIDRTAQCSSQGIIAYGRNGDCVWMNQAAVRMLGLESATSLVGSLNLRCHSWVEGEEQQRNIERVFCGTPVDFPSFGYQLSADIPHDEEATKFLHATSLVPMVEEDGTVVGIYAFHRESSEQSGTAPKAQANRQEDLLYHSIYTARLMANRITHDFNNLLSVVRGYASVLQGRPDLDQESKELAGLIEQAGSHLACL